MNLWAKRSGLMILSALSFFACEEDLSTVGLPPENNLGIFFVDVPLKDHLSQVWIDGISSRATGSILVGNYQDPYFGHMEAKNFSELVLPSEDPGKNFDNGAVFDSLVLESRIRGIYGSNVESILNTIEIYQLTDTIAVADKTYQLSSSEPLGQKLAESSFYIYPDSLGLRFADAVADPTALTAADSAFRKSSFDSGDEYIYKTTFRIDDTYATQFFNGVKDKSAAFSSKENFGGYFKGLSFVPTAGNSAILTYSVVDTKMVLYYTETDSDGNKDQKTLVFAVSPTITYNNISPNKNEGWNGSDFDDLKSFYTPYVTSSGLAYVQSGTNLLLKLDMAFMQQFKDTVENAVIQKAELVYENIIGVSETTPPPASMTYYFTSNDSLANENYKVIPVLSNTAGTVNVSYNSNDNEIRNDITLALYGIMNEAEFNQVILAPIQTVSNVVIPTSKTVNRMVVSKDNVSLRFYYSIPERDN